MTTFVYVCDRLGKSLTHKCFFGMLERAAQLDLPSKKITLSRIQKCTGRIVSWKMLQDVERCWKARTWIWLGKKSSPLLASGAQVESAEELARTLAKKRTLNWFVRGWKLTSTSWVREWKKPRETTWNLVLLKSSQISLAFWFISRLSRYVSLSLRSKQPVALKIRNMSEGVFLTLNQVVLTRRSS